MTEIRQLLNEFDDWKAERQELALRENGPGEFANQTGKSEDDWQPVRSGDWQDSDDSAVALMEKMAEALRRQEFPGYLTVDEIASSMRVSKMTVYRLCASGELPAVRMGRSYRVADVAFRDYLVRGALG